MEWTIVKLGLHQMEQTEIAWTAHIRMYRIIHRFCCHTISCSLRCNPHLLKTETEFHFRWFLVKLYKVRSRKGVESPSLAKLQRQRDHSYGGNWRGRAGFFCFSQFGAKIWAKRPEPKGISFWFIWFWPNTTESLRKGWVSVCVDKTQQDEELTSDITTNVRKSWNVAVADPWDNPRNYNVK